MIGSISIEITKSQSTRDSIISVDFAESLPAIQRAEENSNSVFKLIFSLFLSRALAASPKVRSESPWVTSTSGGCGALPTRRQFPS